MGRRRQSILDNLVANAVWSVLCLLGSVVFGSIASWWHTETEFVQGMCFTLAAFCFLAGFALIVLRVRRSRPELPHRGNAPGFLPISVAGLNRAIAGALPADKDEMKRRYVGAAVKWRGRLSHVTPQSEGEMCYLYLREGKKRWWNRNYIRPSFSAVVVSFPGLTLLEEETEMVIEGTIQGISILSPHLEPARVISYGK